jgi:hypothetical protein
MMQKVMAEGSTPLRFMPLSLLMPVPSRKIYPLSASGSYGGGSGGGGGGAGDNVLMKDVQEHWDGKP